MIDCLVDRICRSNLSIEFVDQKNSHWFINERSALESSVCQLEV
ncbi:hypothetical protein QUB21_30380 [Microcoleus sp. AT9b-C4]